MSAVVITLTQEQVDSVIAQSGGTPIPPDPPHPDPVNNWPAFLAQQGIGEWFRPMTTVSPYSAKNCYKNWDFLRRVCPAACRAYVYASRARDFSNNLPEATAQKISKAKKNQLIDSCVYFQETLYSPDPVYMYQSPYIDRDGLMRVYWVNPQTGALTEQRVILAFPDNDAV